MHDGDFGVEGAEKFNKPIHEALNNDAQLIVLHNCIEDVLGYPAPSADKPFTAYKYIQESWTDWNSIPEGWRRSVEKIFLGGNIVQTNSYFL